jgi:hypothetical protein
MYSLPLLLKKQQVISVMGLRQKLTSRAVRLRQKLTSSIIRPSSEIDLFGQGLRQKLIFFVRGFVRN